MQLSRAAAPPSPMIPAKISDRHLRQSPGLFFPETIRRRRRRRRRLRPLRTSLCLLTAGSTRRLLSHSSPAKCATEDAVSKHKHPKEWIHFVGVGGCGLSALAMLALNQGFDVSGSDIVWSDYMDRLEKAGAPLQVGHCASNIERDGGVRAPDALVISSAIRRDNVEILHANSIGVPVYKRSHWLTKITEPYRLIAVSGTHGKTTTASMLAYVLDAMGENITAVVGGHVPQFSGGNIISGCGQDFVLEADEYDGCFLGLLPYIAVVTNLEREHVDIFPDLEAVKVAFRKFIAQIRQGGYLILCMESAGAYSLFHQLQEESRKGHALTSLNISHHGYSVITYGLSPTSKWSASSILPNMIGGSDYILLHWGYPVAKISLSLPGVHNVLNSLAVIATVVALFNAKIDVLEAINYAKRHLRSFMGVCRRLQLIGKTTGCYVYDDYAHHPTEIRAVLQAMKQMFPHQFIYVIFQPHSYSRVAAFMKEFSAAFGEADHVIVTEIYAAREANAWNISGGDLSASIVGPSSEYIPRVTDVVDRLVVELSSDISKEVIVLTMGAGDINTLGPKLLQELLRI